ncbi:GNAT family N-acetyltransferase [Parvularcula sp. LCG005]|nr:GNAT family N-acetyltransferase [Parvularcula sp. LCG005]WOI53486.1 GNAT family N-acetyltransferase [Parvularcula sp. LCG005]
MTIHIAKEETGSKGRLIAHVEGRDDVGDMTYSRMSPKVVIVDHTGVPDSLRGLGVGVALAERMVAWAREDDFKIVPLCPFFKAQLARHDDWKDVIQA